MLLSITEPGTAVDFQISGCGPVTVPPAPGAGGRPAAPASGPRIKQ